MGKKTDLESVHLVNHSKCMLAAFQNFRQDETMLDVTLVCNGLSLKAHKLILSACSPLFKEMFSDNPCSHPIIILRNYEFCDLKAVIEFVYKGELSVPRERLMSALKVAEDLHIRGLRRSEPNREKYEKLYNQVCGKFSGKKKRKRLRRNSSDSENEFLNVSDSDQQFVESDDSSNAKDQMSLSESQPMDVEPTDRERNLANDKDIRPVVLRVGDHVSSNEESNSKNVFEDEESNVIEYEETNVIEDEESNVIEDEEGNVIEDEESNVIEDEESNVIEDEEINVISSVEHNLSDTDSQKENVVSLKEGIEGEICEPAEENIATSSHLDSFGACSDNCNILLESVPEAAENSFQAEQSVEVPKECSTEQGDNISSPCLSPASQKAQQSEDTKLPDEGKRFICSKCDSVFTSRISFMKHKALGHSTNTEKRSPYKCQHCTFSTEEFDSLKSHLLTHLNKVPFKCDVCSEEFTSEELYKQHASVHDSQKISLHDISSASVEDLFSTQNRIPEKRMEFRCSICFVRFTSKLRCQLHEKTCEGGS